MNFYSVVDQAITLLRQRGRVTYRALKRQFDLDDDALADLTEELMYGQRLAADEDGRVLVWTGDMPMGSEPHASLSPSGQPSSTHEDPSSQAATPVSQMSDAERRQLTVMFCDLVDSTALSSQLDPEDLRDVVRAYQAACTAVIQRFDGHIAQLLGDGLLIYFGYPQAHEDDALRAVRAGLGLVHALETLNARLEQDKGIRLAMRVGIHTGLVVVGEMGDGGHQEHLALGDTPNVASRLQGLAEPDSVLISETTHRLVEGYVTSDTLVPQMLKGVATPLRVYRVLGESDAQSRLDVVTTRGLTPLVGREQEMGLLLERWAQAQEGAGQVVLLNGEAGIGKSRLVQVLAAQVDHTGVTRLRFRCSSYATNSAFAPVVEHVQRVARFTRDDPPDTKMAKLERALELHPWPRAEVVPLVAALLSLPHPAHYPPLQLSPQRQRQKTLEVLVAWLLAETEHQLVLAVWEDVHWADPSTLEFLGLVIDQTPTARMLTVLTARPEFHPPWDMRSHLAHLTLNHLLRPQIAAMAMGVAGGKRLPAEVVEQIVAKTDGVPLFVEELTKSLLESGLLREAENHYTLTGPLPLFTIPATLHDSLMARLDRLSTVKAVAQLGATLGRRFAYDLLQAVSPLDEATLQRALGRLIEAELVYQRGVPPQATYTFKHALIQDAAYQSMLRSTRQQYHQRIAQVLEAQFPAAVETQPELVAQHYTEAGLPAQAIAYWHRAGQRASERSANQEVISHLTTGLTLLRALPPTPAHLQHELLMQTTLGPALMAIKGQAAPEVEHAYARARELCQQIGETPQLFPVLLGLWRFYLVRGILQTAHELGEQLLRLAQRVRDPAQLLAAHQALAVTLCWHGECALAHAHVEQGLALYDAQQHRVDTFLYGINPGVNCLLYAAHSRWLLGYPDQARQQYHAALTRAQDLTHAFTLVHALHNVTMGHQFRREDRATQERAETLIACCTEQGSPLYLAWATSLRGWALAAQGQTAEALAQMRQGLAAARVSGAELLRPYSLALLAEACGHAGHADEGLHLLAEGLAVADHNAERWYEAELYRLKGELLLQAAGGVQNAASTAEECFQQALAVARRQEAKSLELRTAMSLSGLWQQQGKREEARTLLAPIYSWFTEGFDTADLQQAKALVEELEG